jgi:hypothetical protein
LIFMAMKFEVVIFWVARTSLLLSSAWSHFTTWFLALTTTCTYRRGIECMVLYSTPSIHLYHIVLRYRDFSTSSRRQMYILCV